MLVKIKSNIRWPYQEARMRKVFVSTHFKNSSDTSSSIFRKYLINNQIPCSQIVYVTGTLLTCIRMIPTDLD